MTHAAEKRFGSYRVVEQIGAGGMGEVFRAFDTTLERSVAIKVLPAALAPDRECAARLEREARTLAALNHPNIAQVYGLEKSQGSHALVMELIDGSTLAAKIARGPVPVEEALDVGAQIAAALEAAHEVGIVHRDLKPTNVMLRTDGTVKVLDFGIAKTLGQEGARGSRSQAMTQAGVVLGTTGYMSPEQARDMRVDRRTDIWAFGCVLYEMLTGQPAFGGEDVTITLARVLEREPDLSALPASVSPAVRQTLKLCLQKDVNRRARDIGDVRLALGGAFDPGVQLRPRLSLAPWSALAVATAALLGAAWLWTSRLETPQAEQPLMRFTIEAGPGDPLGPTMAISPDGTRVAYRVLGAGDLPLLAVRSLNDTVETRLAGTEGGYNPFFSPDGQWIAYMVRGGSLMKIPVGGGVPVPLAEAAIGRFGSWGQDGFIYAELNPFSGIFRVSDQGGAVERLTRPRRDRHAWPQILPDGRLMYTAALAGLLENGRVEVLSLDTGETTVVLEGGYMARYVASGDANGHLLYVRRGVLYATPFDLERLEVLGERVQLADDVATTGAHLNNAYDVSATGTLVYGTGRLAQRWPIVWADGSGTQPLIETPLAYYTPRLSPDGRRLAYSVENERGQDVYVHDIERDVTTRLTFDSTANLWPVWAPDGEHIAFTSLTEAGAALWWVRADGTGAPRRLLERGNPLRQIMLTPDGTTLAFTEQDPETGSDLWILPLDLSDPEAPVPGEPAPLLKTPINEGVPAFSPDGKWIAYISDELGPYDVWVQPFPGPGGRWQISRGNGGYSFWSETENVLLFSILGSIMRVEYTVEGERFVPGTPQRWFDMPMIPAPIGFETLDLAPDGRRFAALPNVNDAASGPGRVTFLLNVFDELRRRAPIDR